MPTFASPPAEILVYGNRVYDDETILRIAGVNYDATPSLLEMQRQLETTGYFSRVRVLSRNGIISIVVSEKTPWFLFPYFTSDSQKKTYGIAGGMTGLGGGSGMLVGRAQAGSGNVATSLLYRDEYFHESFWILGTSIDYEKSEHDVYEERNIVRHVPNQATNLTLQTGYHLRPNLIVEFDTHLEKHETTETPGKTVRGTQMSHRLLAEFGLFYLNEGLARGFLLKPYFEFTNPWSTYQFYQLGLFAQKSVLLSGEFNWIARPRFEHGNPLPFHQRFELGGSSLRGFPSQIFRAESYASLENDFLLTSWNFWKLKVRPILFADFAYVLNGTRTGIGAGLQVYFRQVAVPAIQIYGGYGFHPKGFAVIAAIGPQI